MLIDEGIINAIVKRHIADRDASGKIVADLQWLDRIVSERQGIDRDERAEDERHRKATQELNARRRKVQELCSHPAATFHGDPSGNCDSHHSCDLCGACY